LNSVVNSGSSAVRLTSVTLGAVEGLRLVGAAVLPLRSTGGIGAAIGWPPKGYGAAWSQRIAIPGGVIPPKARMNSLGFFAYQLIIGVTTTGKRRGQASGVYLNYSDGSGAWTISAPSFTVQVARRCF
jgi:hypothetical protein